MRTTKKCPKCESEYIGEYPSLAMMGHGESNALALTVVTCGDCGYCETYGTPPREKTPEQLTHHLFVWHREPPDTEGPYR
jgi:predicted nucleic-acid-binding Zn-ribbon protein